MAAQLRRHPHGSAVQSLSCKIGEVTMNPDQVKLVQASFAKLQPMAPEVADLFYARLFAMAPNLRELFAKDMDEQKKKFTSMLATAVPIFTKSTRSFSRFRS
jgi:hemoglobin-like flavoprotein